MSYRRIYIWILLFFYAIHKCRSLRKSSFGLFELSSVSFEAGSPGIVIASTSKYCLFCRSTDNDVLGTSHSTPLVKAQPLQKLAGINSAAPLWSACVRNRAMKLHLLNGFKQSSVLWDEEEEKAPKKQRFLDHDVLRKNSAANTSIYSANCVSMASAFSCTAG